MNPEDITLHIIDCEGQNHTIEAPIDMSLNLMEVIRSYELAEEGTVGVCGGMAMCASCQCYIKSDHKLPEMSDEEEAMLSEAFYVKDNNVWEKDQDNKKLIVGVQKLSSIHNRALSKWRSYNVDWSSNDKKQDFFNKSVQEFTKCDHEKEQNKIFVKLTKLSVK